MKRVSRLGIWLCGLPLSFPPASSQALVEREKYLVEHVAHCVDCHTRLLPEGKPDTANALQGVYSQLTTPDITSAGAYGKRGGRSREIFEDGCRTGRTTGPAPHAGIQTPAR